MIRISQLTCAFFVSLFALTAVADTTNTDSNTQVVLDSTQIFTVHSESLKQTYRIQARLPGSYQSNTTKKYPLIIKIDGQWDFPLAASVFNNIYFDGQMPETIVIGIDWSEVKGNVHALRARDLLPSPITSFENSGHAKEFIAALAKEIIPALNQRFRLNGQEILLGGSWGATFATYALLQQPEVFDGAIAIAGDYKTAGDVFDQQLKSLANSQALTGKRLYLGVGKGDSVAPEVLAYAEKLKAANLTGLNIRVDVLDGYGHSGMNVPGYASGYKYVFERPQLTIAPETLEKLTGKYISTDKDATELIVQVESQKLVALIDGEKISLLAKSANEFYYPDSFFNLTFEGTQANIETFFGATTFQKVKATKKIKK